MQYSDEEFDRIMKKLEFRKNEAFRSNPINLEKIITYVKKMEVNDKAFEIIQYLMKEFGISVLLCLQPFYQKIIKAQKVNQYAEKLQRISALAAYVVKPYSCGQLNFFIVAGTAKKGFNLKQRPEEEIKFREQLDKVRQFIVMKKDHPEIAKIPEDQMQKLEEINKKIIAKKYNPLEAYYMKKLITKLYSQYTDEKIEGSTMQETPQEAEEEEKKEQKKNSSSLSTATTAISSVKKQQIAQNRQLKVEKRDQIVKGKPKQTIVEGKLPTQKFSSTLEEQKSQNKQTANNSLNLSFQFGPNYALIPLCCRTFFFDQERILVGEDKRTQFKSYRFPFNPPSIETFKKTICAFLNTQGGQIYIGIKQTTIKKFRYVLGSYLTENDKEEVLKSFRKITESIYPNITHALQVDFIPVRRSPYPQTTLQNQVDTYYFDFSKKPLDLEKCPYRPARYVIRVRVPIGNKDQMYTYIETEYQLNKNTDSKEFVPFRFINQVLVKEISQQVLKKFKEKLLYGQEKFIPVHSGDCRKPQIGNPKNQPEPQDEITDAKHIEAVLYQSHHKQVNLKRQSNDMETLQKASDVSQQQTSFESLNFSKDGRSTEKSFTNTNVVTEDQLRKILKHPLNFIALRISKQRLKKCIDKTPAKDFTTIQLDKNELNQQNLLIIRIHSYSHMDLFLKVKKKIQQHFQKENVQFIGISKSITLESSQDKRIIEEILKRNGHKYVAKGKILEFYSLIVAASYFLKMKDMGFQVQANKE